MSQLMVLRRFLEFNTKVYVGNTARNQCFLLMGERISEIFWPRPNDIIERELSGIVLIIL
jgi:hypothetical protein